MIFLPHLKNVGSENNNEKPMKVTSAESVTHDDDRSVKTVNTEPMSDDDHKMMNIADTTHTAFDDRNTPQHQIYRLMSDSQHSQCTPSSSLKHRYLPRERMLLAPQGESI